MKLGIHLGNNGSSATADSLATLAARAEELGFDSVWTSDHVVIPSSIAGEHPAGRRASTTRPTSRTTGRRSRCWRSWPA